MVTPGLSESWTIWASGSSVECGYRGRGAGRRCRRLPDLVGDARDERQQHDAYPDVEQQDPRPAGHTPRSENRLAWDEREHDHRDDHDHEQERRAAANVERLPALDVPNLEPVSYTHLRAHETRHDLVC